MHVLTTSEEQKYFKRAAKHRLLELRVRDGARGVVRENLGQRGVAAGGPDDAVNTRGVVQQELLQPDAVSQLIADFLLPCPFITVELTLHSRSRGELWHKGDTSGQVQVITELRVDCDQDAILMKVMPEGDGGACHVGFRSCFYRVFENGKLVERP